MERPVIAIIGVGNVGSTIAYTLMMRNVGSKIILVDVDEKRCSGEVQDLSDAIPFSGAVEVVQGTLKHAGQADIIVIAAGMSQKPGQTRLELLAANKKIVASILHDMQPIKKQSIIIMVTNPVDILTRLVQDLSDLPRNQIFGSGTLLDTQRLRILVGKKVNVDPRSINLYVLGEHGDSQCVAWSCADIGGVPLREFREFTQKDLDALAFEARQKAYEIITCKGSTSFGIAACVSAYCQNIVLDQKQIVPVSCFVESLGVCLSMPVILGAQGVEEILDIALNESEHTALQQSAMLLWKMYDEMNS